MILLIRVRAENSVALNFPWRAAWTAKDHVMPGVMNFELHTTSWTGVASCVFPDLPNIGCTVSAPLIHE